MERAVEEATERICEKEANLDKRIEDITRLEARLHEAIVQQQHQQSFSVITSTYANHDAKERRAALELKERVRQSAPSSQQMLI